MSAVLPLTCIRDRYKEKTSFAWVSMALHHTAPTVQCSLQTREQLGAASLQAARDRMAFTFASTTFAFRETWIDDML